MRIVIDTPEEYYNLLKSFDDEKCSMDMLLIKHGTPLPKGHGRLIDGDVLKNQNCCSESYVKLFTIVEADKEGAEE